MESSEDDAGTATNASRRASAREKDVGLAEDVNATSSFQQKSSEARSLCQTPAMSEDNFDGDSVPSPSSQDVNTSTEAILDMIDEIVDGPDAPKRLPLTSDFVDALNEELAATSSNLNIIQESAKSQSENKPQEAALPVNSAPADSETPLPAKVDAPAECSTAIDKSTDIVNTENVDTLPASSSVSGGNDNAVSLEQEPSVVSNVQTEASTNCPLPNIPSSSEEQTVQNVSDISVCEPQDRTVKCVTSSDNRDNVTVESAESTSSDSSVSESKALILEPQTRSPLRRRLVRPTPSDRRPDSTVSSTVDSQTVNIPATEQTSRENITKDVTSSSDAVPTIHGNVKPEEIRNVSEINFCQAETSESPPKKIKLIRKNITGTSNSETPLSLSSVSSEKEQCQSTSTDPVNVSNLIEPVNLSNLNEPVNSVSLLSQSQKPETPILDSNCMSENVSDPLADSAVKACFDEHSQPSIESQHSPLRDDTQKGNSSNQDIIIEPSLCQPSSQELPLTGTCITENETSNLSVSNSSEQTSHVNDLEQSTVFNTQHDNEDYIPLTLPPRSIQDKLKPISVKPNVEFGFKNAILKSQNTELLKNTENLLKSKEIAPSISELESQNNALHTTSSVEEINDKISETKLKSLESKSNVPKLETTRSDIVSKKESPSKAESISSMVESETSVLESKSSIVESKSSELISEDSESKSVSNVLESTSSELESKCNEPELTSSESSKPESKISETESKSTKIASESCVNESVRSETLNSESKGVIPETIICAIESAIVEQKSKDMVHESSIIADSNSTELQSKSSIVVESNISTIESTDRVPESKSKELHSKNSEIQTSITVSESSDTSNIESKSSITDSQSVHIDSKNSEVALSNDLQPKDCDVKLESNVLDSTSSESLSKTSDPQPRSSDLEPQSSDLQQLSSEVESKEVVPESKVKEHKSSITVAVNCQPDSSNEQPEDQKKVPPIKLNLSRSNLSESKLEVQHTSINKNNLPHEESDSTKQVPKLTIKLKQPESPVPKVTIKPIRPPIEDAEDIPCVTKINIKPIVKPADNLNDKPMKSQSEVDNKDVKVSVSEPIPSITKLNIKPVLKPPEKINDVHRKSSSSEISESEYSENDETTSTSDQASASDHGSSEVVPKVTIKLGKPGTESEGKFYTEKNVPKLTIKGIQQDEKLIISQAECVQPEKVPKLTIKTVTKSEGQPLSPKLTIKPLKSPDTPNKELKIPTESFSSTTEGKDSPHVPKITIKPVTRMDGEARTPKKSTSMCDSPEHIPVVTKLNIKPILKPADSGESSEGFDDKVPVVSKLNIKPVIKPKDNDVDSSVDDVPKITKLNIKPLKNPEEKSSEEKDCDEINTDIDENSIPVVTKINIKPIVKPHEEEKEKDSENLSSETGNSSDDNGDHIPVVTKLNIKPIIKPDELQESSRSVSSTEQSIPVVTKLNIKPLVKPGESSPSSPKKEHKMDIPIVTKLNIKPVIRPDDADTSKSKDDSEDKSTKNPPLVMKINMKTVTENLNHEGSYNENYISDCLLTVASKVTKASEIDKSSDKKEKGHDLESVNDCSEPRIVAHSPKEKSIKQNCVPESIQKHEESDERTTVIKKSSLNTPTVKPKLNDTVTEKQHSPKIATVTKCDSIHPSPTLQDSSISKEGKIFIPNETHTSQENKNIINYKSVETDTNVKQSFGRQKVSAVQNCTLLKKLLENTRDSLDKEKDRPQVVNCSLSADKSESTLSACKNINSEHPVDLVKSTSEKTTIRNIEENVQRRSSTPDRVNDLNRLDSGKSHTMQKLSGEVNDSVTKPLEITISDKITNPSSGQDSPRIILKINKTDHGPSAKIITEDIKRPDTLQDYTENTQEILNDKLSPKKYVANSRRKQTTDMSLNLSTGKRLRSSRIVENTDKSQVKKNVGKRPSAPETPSPPQNKESELSILQTKRLKLGQLLSANKPINMSPVLPSQTSPTKTNLDAKSPTKSNLEAKSPTKSNLEAKAVVKSVNHSLLNNENCSKNGNSKLHNILSTLQAKQMQTLANNNTNCSEKAHTVPSEIDCNASMSSSDTAEVAPVENSHPELQEMIINENSEFRDFTGPEDTSQDPLEVEVKPREVPAEVVEIPKPVELTPQPKKRGRPRKKPVSEGAKPVVPLPVPALEERPQRSLRLMRDRPAILSKPRGSRGRGRGRRPAASSPVAEPEPITIIETAPEEPVEERPDVDIDPTSSRIKLPRMTEALDKMPSVCTTPLSSRRRNSSGTFSTGDTSDTKVTLDSPPPKDEFPNTPEPSGSGRGRGGRGSRGGRGRTPRGRGRGRGGGRGAMYMKETLGIYGRVCGPATTTVQLFEEETCMMDDNATPAKPSHLLDEDSQSSVKSSTNESNKMKKSKFADLFDSNKVWTAADVKEYTWPPPDKADGEPKVMMIQEQVAMFLGVKSFKRRYQELKRRTIGGEERDYVLSKGLVTEALCDLGITAVDASEVLDIMLSDYPHKYEEFRSYQRQRQLTGTPEESMEETKPEEKVVKVEMKPEKPAEHKPELPKVDPEKARLDMAAAAIASASEWNARANASRRTACADLQSLVVLRPRAAPVAPARPHLRPPAGFYPHALLPGQYQHSYRVYTPEQLRYFPLNTVLAAPPAPVSVTDYSSESEPEWGSRCSSSDDSDVPTHQSAKRKKLSKVKRASQVEASTSSVKEESRDEVVDTCRVCKLRLEANRKYTHERFLVCANCNAKLHPSCVELNADTIRKCREYPWQCAECKTCCSCRQPADDDKMLFCDLCDRGFHIYCVGLDTVPSGRWHCVECAVCKSCGARSPDGGGGAGAGSAPPGAPADWHHQTRRGPGGHKVYSHSLCTPCARAYRIGRYCPLCERSFIGPKGTMQLVICKLCDRQLHQECVRQTVSLLNVLDYTCAECRRGGITSRAAAVRLAPRTIATLFMAKRRFNKYAHRQYMESRMRELAAPDDNSADPDVADAADEPDADPLDAPELPDHPDAPE